MNINVIKVIGVVSSIASVGATLASNWVGKKEQDAKIAEAVSKEVSKALGKNE